MIDLAGYLVFFAVLTGLGWLLAGYLSRVYAGERTFASPLLVPIERGFYAMAGTAPDRPQTWGGYAMAMLAFNAVGFIILYALLRMQGMLPLNPDGIGGMAPDLAFNTAARWSG